MYIYIYNLADLISSLNHVQNVGLMFWGYILHICTGGLTCGK